MSSARGRRIRRLAVPLIAASLAVLMAAITAQDPQDATAPWPRQGEYVGPDACRRCHLDEASAIAHGVHAGVVTSDLTMQCETCHGPGRAHADDAHGPLRKITHPAKLPPATQSLLCSRCHAPEAAHHGGGGSAGLLAAGLGCTDCHGVHERTPEPVLPEIRFRSRAATLAAAEPIASDKCSRCHPIQAARLQQGAHTRLAQDGPEGGCATCHGNGSLHTENSGVARLISRPDHASDGVATCISCHHGVDAKRAHWKDGPKAFLGQDLDCFACHHIHGAPPAAPAESAVTTNGTCARCHAEAFRSHIAKGTVHAALAEPSLPATQGCASCHRGGVEHANSGGRKELVASLRAAPRAEIEKVCMGCHGSDRHLDGQAAGAHARHDVACTTCHSPSAPHAQVRSDAERGCATCHAAIAARFALPNRHPVDDSHRMHCSSCHDAHTARARLRDTELREEKCVSCHRAYRGPFTYAHQASRIDGCVACHEPHGSSNERMLHEASTQQNCTGCHGDFPSFHDQTRGSVFTNCLNCHTQVHGSNHSRYLLR